MLRLQNAEIALERQGRVVEGVLKDVERVKMRGRLVGREAKEVRAGLEGVEERLVEVVGAVDGKVGVLQEQVGEVEELIGSMHGVMGKQLELIDGVVGRVVGLETQVREGLKREENRVEKRADESTKMEGKEGKERKRIAVGDTTASDAEMKKDAWGRDEVHRERVERRREGAVVRQEVATVEKDGSVVYSFDSPA